MANDYLPTMAGQTTSSTPVARIRLVHLSGSLAGRSQDLQPGVFKLGRHAESQVRFDHASDFLVSTRHGQLAVEDGNWVLTDTHSTNGTYVNGGRVQRQVLVGGQTITLGTPDAAGSSSFRVELEARGSAVGPSTPTLDADAPFAQEPPPSHELAPFFCTQCGAINSTEAERSGQMTTCTACGKPTRIQFASSPPRSGIISPPPSLPAGNFSPSQGNAAPAGEPGFFGGLIGGVKDKIHRMRERREVQRDVTAIESQLSQHEADVRQACATLGQEIWSHGGQAVLGAFPAAAQLTEIDAAVADLNARRAAAEQQRGVQQSDHQAWLSAFTERFGMESSEQTSADQTLAAAQAEQKRSKEAVVSALGAKAEALATLCSQLNEAGAEARQEPKEDFWERYQTLMDDVGGRLPELRQPIADWADLLAAREAARISLAAAVQRRQAAMERVEASRQEQASTEKAYQEGERQHQQRLSSFSAEFEQLRNRLPAIHAELGRQYVDSANPPAINPAPVSFPSARSAVDQLSQARATIEQKKQRLLELDA